MPFERWIHQESRAAFAASINLILSNPPYGERGAMALEDPDEFVSSERTAFAYFMRRALDLLVPGGVGVFLVPAGFLTSKAMRPCARSCCAGTTSPAPSASRATTRRTACSCPAPTS
jgi:hypothetical protein